MGKGKGTSKKANSAPAPLDSAARPPSRLLVLGVSDRSGHVLEAIGGYQHYTFFPCRGGFHGTIPRGLLTSVAVAFNKDIGDLVMQSDGAIVVRECGPRVLVHTTLPRPSPQACAGADVAIMEPDVQFEGIADLRAVMTGARKVFSSCARSIPGTHPVHLAHCSECILQSEPGEVMHCACAARSERISISASDDEDDEPGSNAASARTPRVPASCVLGPRPAKTGAECVVCSVSVEEARIECLRCSCVVCAPCVAKIACGSKTDFIWKCPNCRMESELTQLHHLTTSPTSGPTFAHLQDAVMWGMSRQKLESTTIVVQNRAPEWTRNTVIDVAATGAHLVVSSNEYVSAENALMDMEAAHVCLVGETPHKCACCDRIEDGDLKSGLCFVRCGTSGWREHVGVFGIHAACGHAGFWRFDVDEASDSDSSMESMPSGSEYSPEAEPELASDSSRTLGSWDTDTDEESMGMDDCDTDDFDV